MSLEQFRASALVRLTNASMTILQGGSDDLPSSELAREITMYVWAGTVIGGGIITSRLARRNVGGRSSQEVEICLGALG
jgi:hypothetical protein